jgi:hypothetical protein
MKNIIKELYCYKSKLNSKTCNICKQKDGFVLISKKKNSFKFGYFFNIVLSKSQIKNNWLKYVKKYF